MLSNRCHVQLLAKFNHMSATSHAMLPMPFVLGLQTYLEILQESSQPRSTLEQASNAIHRSSSL